MQRTVLKTSLLKRCDPLPLLFSVVFSGSLHTMCTTDIYSAKGTPFNLDLRWYTLRRMDSGNPI